MNIVVMQERHLAALAEIERACFHAPWSENMLREELGKGIFLVAEQDGKTAGYVGCQTVLDEGYITNVAVSPDFRRQGIARALIAELTAKAGENKLAFVTLEVRESNAPAIALYTGAGFKRIYIAPEFRRKGVASAVITALEQDAAKHGFTKAILETARTTEDSAALYTKLGYRVIPYYGSPAGAENCLCFEKNLGD